MDKAAFEGSFDEVVSGPLLDRGFVRRGKSHFAEIQGVQLGWVRGGGRFASPGSVAHCVCFRHAFLRDKESRVPVQPPGFPEHYPWVFDLELLPASTHKNWRFDPARLMSLRYGQYTFEGLDTATVRDDLNIRLAAFLRYADWAVSLSDSDAVAQLRPFAKDYWIARHWLEDYAARAGAPA